MTAINELTGVDTVAGGDLIPVYSQANGDTRRVAVSVVAGFTAGTTPTGMTTLYTAPSATGFSYSFPNEGKDYWLIVTPTGAFAAGTLVLPTTAVDKQELLVFCTQAVTALTVTGVSFGAPTSLAANSFFRLKYDALLLRWYRVG